MFCVLFSVIFLLSPSLLYAVNMSYPSQHPAIISPASKQPREWVVNNEEIREGAPPGLRLLLYGSYSGEIYGAINQLSLMWGIKQKGCRRLTSNNNCSKFFLYIFIDGGFRERNGLFNKISIVKWKFLNFNLSKSLILKKLQNLLKQKVFFNLDLVIWKVIKYIFPELTKSMYLSLINLNTQIEINWIEIIFSLNWLKIIGSLLANKKQDWSKPRFKSNFKHYWVITDENLSNIRLSLCWGISLYLNNDMEQQSRGGRKKSTWNRERCCSGGAHHLVLFINNTIPEIQQWWI